MKIIICPNAFLRANATMRQKYAARNLKKFLATVVNICT